MSHPIQLPSETIRKWQEIVDLLAELMQVPSALILRVESPNSKILLASKSKENPYERDEVAPPGIYCEAVMRARQPLLVPDALRDEVWKSNPAVNLGMIAYLGVPVSWPDGEIFGTICALDNKPNEYSNAYLKLLLQCRDVLQADLGSVTTVQSELQRRDAQGRLLVEANIIGIFIWDFEGRILEANDAFLRMVDYDRKDLVSGRLRWTDLTPPELLDRDLKRWAPELKRTGSLQPFEKAYFRRDGSRVPVLVGVAIEEAGTQGIAFVLDLTDRKRAEEQQRYHMQLLKIVTDNASSMLYIVDAAGLGTFVNPAFERITGYRAEEVIGQVIHDKIHHTKPDGTPYPARECSVMGAVRQQRVLRGEDLYVRKDGTFFPVTYTASPILHDGAVVGAAIEVQDLTETKEVEAELRNQAQLLSLAHDAIIVRDPGGRIRFWNQGAVKTYGWTAEEAIGKITHELLQTQFPISLRALEAVLQEQGEWEGELTHIARQGTVVVVASRQSLQRAERGAGAMILEINRDITEGKRTAEALRDVQMELAHANRVATMGQLTASIAHEVQQPITATLANAQAALRWLDTQPPVLEEARQALGRIVQDGNRASDVIGRIRGLVGKAPPRKDSLEINEAIREVIALLRGEAMKHGVSVQTRLAEGLPLIQGDRVQLQQVILNLNMNAIEAMRDISEGARDLMISTEPSSSGGVVVAVRDSGPGLDPSQLKRLFEAFYTTKPDGMGMGLAICRSIIEAHGGRLGAEANGTRGATFQFTVPAHPVSDLPAQLPEAVSVTSDDARKPSRSFSTDVQCR